ncbi:hypothetical protein GGS23DRAFT_568704 [Durotheca rogersii]|uniref:uncharacterized protein n=1 Tax=Durotheca rogersii TaxID=419775 RepID=UPI00221EFC71|nr:uncharacterized protein GGS23DRAFT_568704 [Durotheca rogersii]KAI5863201.1 hypothetical protein GGS23DRAFT_568704 [Durotheca rogersii]
MYQPGQIVWYRKPAGGRDASTSKSTGRIISLLAEPGAQAGRRMGAGAEQPRYEIRNERTGRLATVPEKNVIGTA